jgi:type I restriction enzyme S subunit
MKNWVTKKLGEVCELSAGGDVPKDNFSEIKTDKYQIPIYANGEKNEGFYGFTNKAKVTKPSITVSARGTIGYAVKRLEPFFPIVRLIVVTPIDLKELCLDYLDYALRKIDFKHSGSSIPQLTVPMIKDYEISLPPLPEQQRIVAILDEAFAAIAKAKANAEQNLKNAKELFESYLNTVDAEKVSLGSLVDIKTGKLNSNASVENGQYPFFTCSREIFAIDNYAFDLEAILLAGNNASGDFNVKHYKGKFNAYQRTYVITVDEKQKILYRYLYFQLLKSLKEFKEMSVGANTRFLKLGMIQGLQIALPSLKEQQIIVQKLDALSTETKKLEAIYTQKINDLEELKKSVLQKAFSGELKTEKAFEV